MFALFEDNQFIKLLEEAESNVYQIEPRFLLYKIDLTKLKYKIDMYKFCLDINSNLLAYLDESKLITKVSITECIRVEESLSLWQKLKQFFGQKS